MKVIELHCDGSGTTIDKVGGWGAILVYGDYRKELSGAYDNATNNMMEIAAVLHGLQAVKMRSIVIEIHSDSQNAIYWINSDKSRHDNKSRQFANAIDGLACDMDWTLKTIKVEGHSRQAENERCHVLANEARLARIAELEVMKEEVIF